MSMAPFAPRERSRPVEPSPDELQRLDDEFDFPSWIYEPRPDASDLQEFSARTAGPSWLVITIGVVAAAIAATAILGPLAHSALEARRGLEQPRAAQYRALPPAPAPARQEQAARPAEQNFSAARKKLVDDLPRLAVAPAAASTPPVVEANAAPEPQPRAVEPSAPPSSLGPPMSVEDARRMLARAGALVREGQIGSARALLELAARSRDPSVYVALADTYNPKMLARWHAIGIAGDEARALALYRQAADSGMAEASARLRELSR
jgi:hypothetical protein